MATREEIEAAADKAMKKNKKKPKYGKKKTPCWKGYEMVGMKDKGGKEVPNCVPKK
jgi:hypothetical protein